MRDILHLHIPTFPIAVARVADPALRRRPVAVAPGHSPRALIQCLSAEAELEGLHEGMPVHQALRYCPGLTLLPPDPQLLSRAHRALLELTSSYSPVWEPAAPGRLYLDLTGSHRLLGPGRDAAARLERAMAASLRLPGGVGVAGNKLVSRIAAGCLKKPGVCDVLRGSEAGFIAPLPVSVLPGVGQVRAGVLLEELSLRHVGEVAALSVPQLRLVFGPVAGTLHQRARGIDPTPVRPPERLGEVCEETFLPRAENDDTLLLATLCRLAERCGLRLRRQGRLSARLQLITHFADGVVARRACPLSPPRSSDAALFGAARQLYVKACQRRVRVKGMALRCQGLVAPPQQLDLFASETAVAGDDGPLQEALDRLRTRHGQEIIHRGTTLAN